MATSGTIQASKQIAWSGTNYTYYLTFNWKRVATGIDSNGRPTSTIRWNLYTNRSSSSSGTYYTITSESAISSNGALNYSRGSRGSVNVGNGYYLFSDANFSDTSKDFVITHNADGTAPSVNITIHMNAIYSNDTGKVTTVGTINVDSIPVKAELVNAPNFNDEQNPTITYSNPAGNSVNSLQACISLTGENADIEYRNISKTGTSYTFNLTTAERNVLRNATIDQVRNVVFIVRTIIGNNTYYSSLTKQLTIVNANPVFTDFEYQDINTTTRNVLNNSQYLVKDLSSLRAIISTSNKMVAQKGASPKLYIARYGGKIKGENESSSTVNIDLGTISNIGNQRMEVTAYDTRNFSTSVYKYITVLDYAKPVINASITRLNNFENTTTMTINGTFSRLTIENTDKNTIESVKYRYRESGGTWNSQVTLTSTISNGTYTCNNVTLNLDNTKAFEFEIEVKDKLQTTTTTYIVDIGQAIFFISSNQRKCYYNGKEILEYEVVDDLSKSIKLKNDVYWDSAGIVHNKKLLSDILSTKLYSGDLNDIKTSGFTWVNINATNRPTNGVFALTTIAVNNNYVFQEANESVNNPSLMATYQRHCYNGTWTAWKRIGDNYSTTEQVIGTWIDGKPIYRKVIEYTNTSTIGNASGVTNVNIPHGISNIKRIIKHSLCATGTSGLFPFFVNANSFTALNEYDSTYVKLKIINDTWNAGKTWYIILEYTKTTD